MAQHKYLELLAIAAEDLHSANKSMRNVIHSKDDEVARLDELERKFRELKYNFDQYKKSELKHAHKTKGFQDCIKQELVKDERILEKLNKEVSDLNICIKEQAMENDKFERDLRENVERLRLFDTNEDGGPPMMSNNNSIVKRLLKESKAI